MENNQRRTTKKVGIIMPKGKGTYGSKKGRPPKSVKKMPIKKPKKK